VEFDLQEETLQLYILKFILQPIIENSLFHGFQNMDFHGVIVLRSFISGDKLVIEIEDNGRGFSTNPEQNSQAEQLDRKKMCTKIGLSNVRNRINIHFKGEGNLSLESPAKGGALVRIELPVLGELQKV